MEIVANSNVNALSMSDVTCIDIIPEFIEIMRRRGLKAFCVNVHDMSKFEDGKFDLVIFPYSMSHVRDFDPALSNVKRVLKDDGELMMFSFRSDSEDAMGPGGSLYSYSIRTLDEYMRRFKQAGFNIKKQGTGFYYRMDMLKKA